MKLLKTIAFASLLSANAFAAQSEISLDSFLGINNTRSEVKYSATPELNRAFLVVTLSDQFGHQDERPSETFKVKVEGLALDPSTGEIVLQEGSKKLVCAYPTSFLGSKYYKTTGDCKVSFLNETRKIDDGFELKNKRFLKVNIEGV